MRSGRPRIEYYFSFISLWSYIGGRAFEALVRRYDAEIVFKPFDLYRVFSVSGGKPPKERAVQRQSYRHVEMERWRTIRDIPLVFEPKFYPADPSLGHRMLLAAVEQGLDPLGFAYAAMKAVWADELDVADPQTLVTLADATGLPGRRLSEQARDPDIAELERSIISETMERQVFGAPFYIYRGEPFWGQDRLDLLADAIETGRPPILPSAIK